MNATARTPHNHSGGGDDTGGNLLHRRPRRVQGAQARFELPLDVFHHHDRIVDDEADRETMPSSSACSGETERSITTQGRDQRHGDGNWSE